MRSGTRFLTLLASVGLLAASPAHAGVLNTRTSTTYATISAAVASALDGDTLEVGAGTYVEQVLVDKSLSIHGAGPRQVLISWNVPGDSIFTALPGVSLDLRGVRLTSAGAARGVFADSAEALSVEDVVISGTNAIWGGGIHAWDTESVVLRRVAISDSSASRGGGISLESFTVGTWSAELEDVVVRRGTAGDGGGIYLSRYAVTCVRCAVEESTASLMGGGLAMILGELHSSKSVWRENTAVDGGGIFHGSGRMILAGDRIVRNNAEVGGGLYLSDTFAGTELVLVGNSATSRGAAIGGLRVQGTTLMRSRICGNHSPGATVDLPIDTHVSIFNVGFHENVGSATLYARGPIEVVNSSFVANSAVDSALYITGSTTPFWPTRVRNTLIAHTSGGSGAFIDSSPSSMTYNAYYGNDGGPMTGGTPGPSEMVGLDPMVGGTIDGLCDDDLRLAPGSPLIDAGAPYDLDRDGSRADMGARGGPSGS